MIIYRKGPFPWWCSRKKFKAMDVESIREGEAFTGIRAIPRPAVFFKTRRSLLLLDLTGNTVKCQLLWIWLETSILRGLHE